MSITPGHFNAVQLSNLQRVATLGTGGFGRVELVQIQGDPERSFALKQLKKAKIVEAGQQDQVMSEREILAAVDCGFIVKMFKTFKDNKRVYMLMECCLGGELWRVLKDRGTFSNDTTRFYIACVTKALHYLHVRRIVFRDLKPENLLLDSQGYVKLADFGLAQKLPRGEKIHSACGTIEYLAPEIIRRQGHDKAVDYWSLGILMFEFLTGSPPFKGSDGLNVLLTVLKGIDEVEFPRNITTPAKALIKRLCRTAPSKRLGYSSGGIRRIQRHQWFDRFHWEGLVARTLMSPFLPAITNVTDTSNFDQCAADSEAEDVTEWDPDF